MDGLVDIFSLAWTVPLIMDSMMAVASAVYDYFVGNGIIQALMGAWVVFWIGLYLVKMYFPKNWLALFGFSGGGEAYTFGEKFGGWQVGEIVFKPMMRAIFAMIILLPLRPTFITQVLIEPFFAFGAMYTDVIIQTVMPEMAAAEIPCPHDLGEFMSEGACRSLARPVHNISVLNNSVIMNGFQFLLLGFGGGFIAGFMNIITGLFLIVTFFTSNLFTALLLIQGIFKFGLELIFYPFRVLISVVKSTNEKEKTWFDPITALGSLADSLKALIIAMIAVSFMLIINISVVRALFNASPDVEMGFGGHSITWLSAIMTFLILQKVFVMTRDYMEKFVTDKDMTGYYDKVSKDAIQIAKNAGEGGKKIIGLFKT